eukprot:COSAG02_NODE_52353_length_308_cov_0.942584_2_plen_82_part_01
MMRRTQCEAAGCLGTNPPQDSDLVPRYQGIRVFSAMSVESVDAQAIDESASTEVRAYGTGDVHQSRDDQLQDLANNGLHRML